MTTPKPESLLPVALRNLRHLYEQMLAMGGVTDTAQAAKGLLGPAIERIEFSYRYTEARVDELEKALREACTMLERVDWMTFPSGQREDEGHIAALRAITGKAAP